MCRAYPKLTAKPDMWGEERRDLSCFQRRKQTHVLWASVEPDQDSRAEYYLWFLPFPAACWELKFSWAAKTSLLVLVVSLHVRVEAVKWVKGSLHHYRAWGAWFCVRWMLWCQSLSLPPQKFPIFLFSRLDLILEWNSILKPTIRRTSKGCCFYWTAWGWLEDLTTDVPTLESQPKTSELLWTQNKSSGPFWDPGPRLAAIYCRRK